MAQNYLEADGVSRPLLVKIPVENPSDARLRICYDGPMGNWEALARAHGIPDGEEFFARQVECLEFLHNNASLRLDRMNQCHGLRVAAPLISGELRRYAMTIRPESRWCWKCAISRTPITPGHCVSRSCVIATPKRLCEESYPMPGDVANGQRRHRRI